MASPGPALAERMIVDKSDFLALVSDLGRCREFAFDTEFVGEDTYIPVLCLIQVATRDALYLVDPIAIQDVTPFWKLVADPKNTVIVHGGREEVRLCRQWSGSPPAT